MATIVAHILPNRSLLFRSEGGQTFVRTFVFELLFVLLIPELFGAESIWFSITFAEIFALAVGGFALYKYRNRYGYAGGGGRN